MSAQSVVDDGIVLLAHIKPPMSSSASSTAVSFDDLSQEDYTSAIASSSSALGIDADAADGPDPAVRDALKNSKERIFVLKMGEDMESLIRERRNLPLHYTPVSSYHRMLVYRCAQYHKLLPDSEGSNKAITVSLLPESRIPPIRLLDVVPPESSTLPAMKIMRRTPTDRIRRSRSADANSDDSDGGSSGKTGLSARKKRNMTMAERQEAYDAARTRIFSRESEGRADGGPSTSSSSQSLSSLVSSSSADRTASASVIGDEDSRSASGTQTSSSRTVSIKNGTRKVNGKERWIDAPKAPSPTNPQDDEFDPDFDRSVYGYSNPTLHPAYDSQHPHPYPYDPNASYPLPAPPPPHAGGDETAAYQPHAHAYAMYPPYGGHPPQYIAPYPYYYDPRHYYQPAYPPPPPPDGTSPSPTAVTSPPPAFMMYPAPWYPQMPPPMPPPHPVQGHPPPSQPQNSPPNAISPSNSNPNSLQSPNGPPAAYFNPGAPPFYPHYSMTPYPPPPPPQNASGPVANQPQPYPPQHPQPPPSHAVPPGTQMNGPLTMPPPPPPGAPGLGSPFPSGSSGGNSRFNSPSHLSSGGSGSAIQSSQGATMRIVSGVNMHTPPQSPTTSRIMRGGGSGSAPPSHLGPTIPPSPTTTSGPHSHSQPGGPIAGPPPNPWTYSSVGRRAWSASGSSSSRAASVISSRSGGGGGSGGIIGGVSGLGGGANPKSGSGSGGSGTPADETRSIASSETSSSSSRKTFTSTSSRHPLPARPDWAVNLPTPHHPTHSRRSSGSSSVFHSISDFPPLSSGVSSIGSASPRTVSSPISTTTSLSITGEPLISKGVWRAASSPGAPSPGGLPGASRHPLMRNGSSNSNQMNGYPSPPIHHHPNLPQSPQPPRRTHSGPGSGGSGSGGISGGVNLGVPHNSSPSAHHQQASGPSHSSPHLRAGSGSGSGPGSGSNSPSLKPVTSSGLGTLSSVPPPPLRMPSLPPNPLRAYASPNPSKNDDSVFKRPAPKNPSLFDPSTSPSMLGSPGSAGAGFRHSGSGSSSPSRGSPLVGSGDHANETSSSTSVGGILSISRPPSSRISTSGSNGGISLSRSFDSPLVSSPSSPIPGASAGGPGPSSSASADEKNRDRLRGEAVANAILVDKMAALHLPSSTSPLHSSSTPPPAIGSLNGSGRESPAMSDAVESLARRGTITQASHGQSPTLV